MNLDRGTRARVKHAEAELEAAEREERPLRPIADRRMTPMQRRRAHQARTLARVAKAQAKSKADSQREPR